jgi:hypothetical protein
VFAVVVVPEWAVPVPDRVVQNPAVQNWQETDLVLRQETPQEQKVLAVAMAHSVPKVLKVAEVPKMLAALEIPVALAVESPLAAVVVEVVYWETSYHSYPHYWEDSVGAVVQQKVRQLLSSLKQKPPQIKQLKVPSQTAQPMQSQ